MVNYYWRMVVTSGCFIAFAVCGLLFSVLLFPVLRLISGERRRAPVRWLIHKFFSLILTVLRSTGCMRLEIAGVERLRNAGAVLVLANHPTYIDVVVLLSLLPTANCVVKSDHWDNPVFGGILRAAGWIRGSRADQLALDCSQALDSGDPLIIFPEGTRSDPGAPMKFLRGAAYIAVKSGKPIVPVLLQCDPGPAAAVPLPGSGSQHVARRHAHRYAPGVAGHRRTPPDQRPGVLFQRGAGRPVSDLKLEIKRLIIEVLALEDIAPEDIADDAPLFGDGLGLDSIDALELGIALRKRYQLKLEANDAGMKEHFRSVSSLCLLVERQRGAA